MKQDAQTAQHTPGPWKADKWATGWTVSAPDSHYSVCHLEGCNNADANARLIAAAPELLAACKMVVERVLESDQVTLEELDQVKAAIAKAEGKP